MRANLVIQMMQLSPNSLQSVAIVRLARCVTLSLKFVHLRLERGFVDANDDGVLMGVDAERLAERRQQMILVHLRRAFDGVVLDGGRDRAQFLERFLFQLVIRVSHDASK
jgi:hypothetical protein